MKYGMELVGKKKKIEMMKYNINQMVPFHLVAPSPFPLLVAFNLKGILIGIVLSFTSITSLSTSLLSNLLLISIFSLLISLLMWKNDLTVEGSFLGNHTSKVQSGINFAFLLFLLSEIALFISIFWTFFHSALSPTLLIGISTIWPTNTISPFYIPLLGSAVLFSSSISVTISDYAVMARERQLAIYYLILTLIKGVYFTLLQLFEYSFSPFSADSLFGSIFFIATGLHGSHIIIGSLFLLQSLLITTSYLNTDQAATGNKVGIIYWHFVDLL